jgi:hypothetical protein
MVVLAAWETIQRPVLVTGYDNQEVRCVKILQGSEVLFGFGYPGRRRLLPLAALLCIASALPLVAQAEDPVTIGEKTKGMQKHSGLLDFYTEKNTGKVWLQLAAANEEGEHGRYLYFEGLVSGLGSNPIGLDRSQLGETRYIRLRSMGGRVFLEQLNTRYRALSQDVLESRATEQSFATSVLWAGDIAARDDNGAVLVDLTSFLVRDAHGVSNTLSRSEQGNFSLDDGRSAVDLNACLAFPENIVFEAMLTFGGSKPGSEVRATAPDPETITLTLHHSFLQLPDDGYQTRNFDPRIGSLAIEFADYATPLDEPLVKRWIIRYRLQKVTPGSAPSRVHDPIVYYVDSGAPELVRNALLDGARWWTEAFERAGFIDAFRVEVLPDGAHPLDVRYNVINWVHRATRGWSYGWGVIDPRTGEMVKGHVLLGSLRVRQDRLLFEGMSGTEKTGTGGPDDPVQLALARIRQLSAHEVGHTLGVTHNFTASTYGRESVMDYPAPLVLARDDDSLDFSEAYAVGIGKWDTHTIRYSYSEFDAGTEQASLDALVQEGLDQGLHFISDSDARPAGAAQPLANLWDNGELAEVELVRLLNVRRIALQSFGEHNVAVGRPLAELEEVLAPVYYMHRYSLNAAAKVIAGVDYRYAVRGDSQPRQQSIDAARQTAAVNALLLSLQVENLDLPDNVLQVMHPRPYGYDGNRELFSADTRPMFDALGAAQTLASMVASNLLQPARCARLVDQHRLNPELPGLGESLAHLMETIFEADRAENLRHAEIQQVVQVAVVDALIALASNSSSSPAVTARVEWMLADLKTTLERQRARDAMSRGHQAMLVAEIGRYLERSQSGEMWRGALDAPPGSPIGSTVSPAVPAAWSFDDCSWGGRP